MSDSDCDSEEEVSGMIRSTLIHELKAILDEYPDNGQILKELIQNAEDAGASEIKIIFDSDGGGHKTSHHPHLSGPSLYVYNDALFTEKDWTGIKMLRKSVKEHDPLKVGRFGLGFKSVFHLTDYPSVLSGDTLLFLDPGKPESKACSAYPLKRKGKTISAMVESQAPVFDHLNTDFTGNRNFHGTLFRFPLRTVPTELSTLTHDRSRILNLMKTCETELEFVLIFLKSLSKVELIHLESHTTSNVKFSVLLHENSKQQRKLQKESLQKALINKITYHSTTDLKWAVEKQDGGRYDKFKQTCKVTNVYLGKDCMSVCMQTLCDDPTLSYCPYVSVAFMDLDERCLVKGHVFCFLPLPLQDSTMTGLPVFVNGFFALSSNRHHLKWPTADEEGSSWEMQKDKACLWNHCLITEALPQVYRTFLLELKKDCERQGNNHVFVNRLYKAFPDPSLVSCVWKPLVDKLYSNILDDNLFWTNCDGGKWVSVREAIFVLESNNENNTATSMILLQQRICFVPDHILKAVSQYMASQVTVLYPSLVRTVLKKSEQYQSLERTRKLNLLSYILSDITEDSIEELEGIVLVPLANGSFTTFKNDELCSLASVRRYLDFTDDNFWFVYRAWFRSRCLEHVQSYYQDRPPVYIATEDFPKSLFPFLDTDFLADVPEEIQQHMNRVSQFEESCLQVVDKEVIPSLVNRVLQSPQTVTWMWVLQLWTMLYMNFPESLDEFENLNILPLGNESSFSLSRLTKPTVLVVKKWKDLRLNDDIEQFVTSLGVQVVHEVPQEVFKHPIVFGTYIYGPSSKALLNVMTHAVVHLKVLNSLEMSERQTTAFVSFISQYPDDFSADEERMLISLKLFQAQNPSGQVQFCSIQEINSMACEKRIPVNFCSRILFPRTSYERRLALKLGANELSFSDMVNTIIENMAKVNTMYSEANKRAALSFLLPELKKKTDIKWSLAEQIEFVPCSQEHNILRKPCDLFDPTDSIVRDLFVGENVFPQQEFSDNISELKHLGLKPAENITSEDILMAAEGIHTGIESLPARDLQVKSDAVIFQLASMPEITSAVLSKLKDTKFISKAGKPRHVPVNFDWFDDKGLFYRPSSLLVEHLGGLYGSVLPVAKLSDKLTDQQKDCLKTQLQFITCPSLEHIVKQLKITIHCWNCERRPFYIDAVETLYCDLTKYDNNEVIQTFEQQDMMSEAWVWTGNEFSCPRQIHLECQEQDVNLKPFSYILPQDMCDLKDLLLLFGSHHSQNKDMYAEVLNLINLSIERGETAKKHQYLEMVISILQALVKDNMKDFDDILLPVEDGDDFKLKPWEQCVNSEKSDNFLEDNLSESDSAVYYLHKAIPHHLSQALKVPSLMDKLLDTQDIDLNFGQAERITQRLKDLTNQYSDGMAVVKELIQNADDAKASKICFLYDERENLNARKGLLSSNLSEFQGSALWAFNDAEFSDLDFESITKISGATKETDTTKIGRFGLGFNAVYNLTDLPSFISRDNFVIFDPHTIYLNRPGVRFSMKRNKVIMKTLSDQFKPFHGIFGCDVSQDRSQRSKGTLFRFPLRTSKQASCSEIRTVEYTRREMIDLIQLCLECLGDLLLFTQNVKEFHFYYLPKYESDASKSVLLFSATKMLNESTGVPPITQTPVEEMRKMYNNKQTERLAQLITVSTDINKSTCVGLELTLRESKDMGRLANWSLGKGKGREFLETNRNIKGVMPVATVAVPLDLQQTPYRIIEINKNPERFPKISTVYNYLPLPITTKLPVVINGSFVVSSDRQRIITQSRDEKNNTESEWNKVLLEDSVSSAYVDMLLSLVKLIPSNTDVLGLWPMEKTCGEMLQPVLKNFYSMVLQDAPKILPGCCNWASFDSAVFLDDKFQSKDIRYGALDLLCSAWADTDKTVVDMPASILKLFPKNEVFSHTVYIKNFYQDYMLPRIDEMEIHTRDKLVLFALESKDPSLLEILKCSKCIPVFKRHNTLCCPSDLVHPLERVATLYDDADGRFPSKAFRDPLILETLCELGMIKNELPNAEIINRAYSIAQTSATDERKAKNRFHTLLKTVVLSDNKLTSFSLDEKLSIATIPFIPVSRRPKHWPDSLVWKGDSILWGCPSDVHRWTDKNIVGCERTICEDLKVDETMILLRMGICDGPSPDDVVKQLQHLSDIQKPCEKWKHTLQHLYESIYHFIEASCIKQSTEYWETQLSNIRYIYVHNRHVEAKKIQFLDTRHDCRPYLFSLPTNYARKYKTTMALFGVKYRFDVDDIKICLNSFFTQFQDNQLQDSDIDLLNCIMLVLVQTSKQPEAQINWNDEDILLPDQTGTLYPLSMLCFNDCPWINNDTELYYIHSRFSKEVAATLGVQTSQAWCANENSEGIEVPFGQREELTTRLRGLLNGYPCDEAIFKELLQNADDAGASRMVFVKDLRRHGDETVFSDNWKYLQGPALCVYNDKPFTKKDIEGIQNLGEGSKSQDQLKTGKYGVGFNAVYHITDVPSFITKSSDEETLCVFDPNRQYVPNITNNLSGRKYDHLNLHRKRFPDVYSCYPQELMEEGGTLFRFPLRTKEMAQMSKIKNDDFTKAKLEELVDRFQVEANECLLFLKTVRTIQFFKILDDGGMVCEYEVNAEVENAHHFNIELQHVASELKSGGKLQNIKPKTFKSFMKVERKAKGKKLHETTWYVEQRIGFENVEELPENLVNAFDEGRIGCLPTGGLAFPINPQRNGNQKAFRHLPLPVTTHLPVAVDAHFVLDHENRRNIYSSQNKDLSATWNLQLAENLLAPLYASALFNRIKDKIISPKQITRYYNYFPSCLETSDLWKVLSISTYKHLDRKSFPVLIMSKKGESGEIVIKLFPPTGLAENKAYFDTLNSFWLKNDTADTLTDIIKRLDFNLIDTPNRILENFRASYVEVLEVNPTAVLKYLRSHPSVVKLGNGPTDIQETSFQSRSSLLRLLSYCCSSEEIQNVELLPLRLTCDQRLYFFQSSDPVYLSTYHSIWEKSLGRFLDLTAASKMQITDKTLKEHTQVVPLMISDLKELLPLEIDAAFVKGEPIERKLDGSGLPNSGQIRLIWKYLNGQVKDFTGTALRDNLKCLSEWPLIPVTRVVDKHVKKLLAPISFANQIICESEYNKGLLEQLKAQGMLTLDKEDFSASNLTLQSLVISTSDALSLLQGISLMLESRPLGATCNQLNQITEILPYFGCSDSLRQLQSNPYSKDQLKKLPFYVTLSDTTTDIATCSAKMLSQSVPQNGIESLLRKHDIVILKYNSKLRDLYQYLDVTVKSDIEFYCQYIFEWFHELNETNQMTHLLFVRDTLIYHGKNNVLSNSLQHLAFIPFNEVLLRTSCFYDHKHPVFSTMLESYKFVPNSFRHYKWHEMLKLSGLITSVSSGLFIELTQKLEAEASKKPYDKDRLEEKSEVLVNHLFTKLTDKKHKPILIQIYKVKFLVSNLRDSKLKKYGPYLLEDSEMISFHGSFYPKYLKLIWTVGKILPKYATRYQLPPDLGVPEKPSVHLVVRNLLNIIRTVESSNMLQTSDGDTVVKDLEDIFKTHYEFLQQCSRSELQELTDSKCILVIEHRCLARPDMVVQTLYKKDLKPYLVSQSLQFGPFCELFNTLGVAQEDSIRHYVNVLRLIKDSSGDKFLHPNEMKVVIAALIAIEETLRKANKDEDLSSGISQLYLPVKASDKVVLMISTETVILDSEVPRASFQNTFPIVADLGDSIGPMELYKVLPIEHRPHLVSNLIFEELTTSCRLKCVKTPICCQLESSIKSEEMLEGVVRILKHKNVTKNEMLDEHQDSLKTFLRSIRVFAVTEIETHYISYGKTLPESRSDKRWFATRSEDKSEIHLIFNSLWIENESFDKFTCFTTLLCNNLQDMPGMVLVAAQFSTLLRLVFNNESVEDHLNLEGITKFCDHKETKQLLPPAGTYIPVDYHNLLDASFTFFDNGEYIGFELFDPLHDDEDGDPVYIYAIVLEQVQEMPNLRWNWQRQYRVNLGQDIKVVSATDLYKLHRKQTTLLDVEIYTGTSTDTPEQPAPDKSLKDVKEEIFEMLKDVWDIEDMRKKVIKRFLLTWHPDKNIGNETFCTKVTQYILKLIERFMAGNFKKMADDDVANKSGFEEAWCTRNAGFYSNFFKRTSRRAHSSSQRGFSDDFTDGRYQRGAKARVNPQPTEGKRWFRQAEADCQSILLDNNPCWVYFKCQQAVEKALKALVYMRDANSPVIRSHNLRCIASQACSNNFSLTDTVERMLGILGENCYVSTRYPDSVSGPQIPDEVYRYKDTTKAHELCNNILAIVKELIFI